MANPGCLKGTRVLKVVFGYRCPHRCDYCAVKNSSRYGEWENLLLDPLKAAPLIEKAAERYTFSGIEIGAGESFLHPDLFRWIVDLNNRRLQVPLFLFASPGTPGAEEVVEIMETSETPVYMLVSADGPLSERNRGNWPETVDHSRPPFTCLFLPMVLSRRGTGETGRRRWTTFDGSTVAPRGAEGDSMSNWRPA